MPAPWCPTFLSPPPLLEPSIWKHGQSEAATGASNWLWALREKQATFPFLGVEWARACTSSDCSRTACPQESVQHQTQNQKCKSACLCQSCSARPKQNKATGGKCSVLRGPPPQECRETTQDPGLTAPCGSCSDGLSQTLGFASSSVIS